MEDDAEEATACQNRLATPNSKISRLLERLVTGVHINRFQAEREIHDHVLNSSIAALHRRFGISASRRRITLPALAGTATVSCCEYWLTGDDLDRARQLIARSA